MKRVLFLFIVFLFFNGCSYKNKVTSYQEKFNIFTSTELAELFVKIGSKMIPSKKIIERGKSQFLIYKIYNEKNIIHMNIKVNNMDKNISEKDFINEFNTKNKFELEEKLNISFCKKPSLRAILKSGVILLNNIEVYKKNYLLEVNEEKCKKYFDKDNL